ncbi:DUF3316 domain-containing protein [Vibrio sp. Of7-15]|uniref:DUF3316 domain-containing protein n=1 Tax=Vibrio sp. Of7-15 TaxID=2724879 RepID=UPI001EF24B9E|nr:DUF3316 domain-containing protein [Vibrio sp. Of7-15]MCG7499405.1 DUF3316 domain-containing protein [Vibrio sp. Of7-15]
MKKALCTVIALSLFSAQALAHNFGSRTSTTILKSESVNSKSTAYDRGYSIMQSLNSKSSKDLRTMLKVHDDDIDPGSFKINYQEVTVREYSTGPGVMLYQAAVMVQYQYRVHDHD